MTGTRGVCEDHGGYLSTELSTAPGPGGMELMLSLARKSHICQLSQSRQFLLTTNELMSPRNLGSGEVMDFLFEYFPCKVTQTGDSQQDE